METKTKRAIAIWAIVLLVVLNISSLGTIWFHRYQFRQETPSLARKDRLPMNPRGKSRTRQTTQGLPGFFAEKMNLTPTQKELMDSIWASYRSQKEFLEDEMHKNRRAMLALLSLEELDTSAYRKLSSNQTELLARLDNSLLEMSIAFRANLNETQRELLNENFRRRRGRMMSREHQPRERK